MGKIVRGYWDCQYCGHTGIGGDQRSCTGCGHPRDESVTFYMKEVEYLSDEEAAKVSKNADWYCSYCDTLNSDNDMVCKSCGASREDSEKNYFDIQAEKNKPKEEFVPFKNEPPKKQFSLWPFIILGAIALLAFLFFRTKTKEAEIESFAWERDIAIEQLKLIDESTWEKNQIPGDAENLYSRQEEHPTEKELVGYQDVEVEKSREVIVDYKKEYKDLGNGNFEEYEVPVYGTEYYTVTESQPIYRPVVRTHYYYSVWRWTTTGYAHSEGDDQDPYWADVSNLKDNERPGIKTGKYYINVKIKKKVSRYEVTNEDAWSGLKKGQEVIIKSKAGSKELLDSKENFISNLY